MAIVIVTTIIGRALFMVKQHEGIASQVDLSRGMDKL